MKHLRKLMALVLVAMVSLAVSTTAWAASITINSGAESGTTDNTEYTYYKFFKADIGEAPTVNAEDGTSTGGRVSYYLEQNVAADSQLKAAIEADTTASAIFKFTVSV